MSDVRGASGVPPVGAFGGVGTPTPSTPLYVDLATGDLYVLINETVTLVGSVTNASNLILTVQSFSNREPASALLGDASQMIAMRSLSPHPLPTMWS